MLLLASIVVLKAGPVMDLSSIEEMAVQDGGRTKPFYVFAVESLRRIHGKAEWSGSVRGEDARKWPAMNVVVDMAFHPDDWMRVPIIRVDHLKLKDQIGLERENSDGEERKYYSYDELAHAPGLQALLNEVLEARRSNTRAELTPMQEAARQVGSKMELFERLLGGRAWAIIPDPKDPEYGAWVALDGAAERFGSDKAGSLVETVDRFYDSYEAGNQSGIDVKGAELSGKLRQLDPSVYPNGFVLGLEHFYIKLHPFRCAWILYLASLVVLVLTSVKWRETGYLVGWMLAFLAFFFQLSGFVMRILISHRAPVTNMYETVIWLGFGAMLFALVFEGIYRCRYFLLGGVPVAIVSLILGDSLPVILDSSIQPLVPVLRHNFWLTTHVLTITSSYAAFALALGVAHIILGKIVWGREVSATLYQYLYRAMQVGVLLIGIGTILGGVWANYSWGRFWDWDPKETWALIAFLSYLAVLHGRIAGWWGGFGLAVGSVLGFLSVLMAWYGVNFVLGKGLHSYGFGTGGFWYVLGFVLCDLSFLTLAILVKTKSAAVRKASA